MKYNKLCYSILYEFLDPNTNNHYLPQEGLIYTMIINANQVNDLWVPIQDWHNLRYVRDAHELKIYRRTYDT